MSVVSSSIPNLINGISEQNPTQRNLNQAETQINAQSNIVKGLQKRPPLEWVSNLLSTQIFSTNTAIHSYVRDDTNKFFIAAYNGGIKVFDLAGNAKTVSITNGSSYLATTNPKDQYKFISVADTTFILNTSKKPLMSSTTSAAKINEALVYVKQSNYGRTYSITLTHPSMNSGNPLTSTFVMPNGDNVATQGHLRDTATIASVLRTGSGHSPGSVSGTALTASAISNYFTITQYNSVIHIKPSDNNAAFTISTSDGAGDSGMYVIRDTINDFTDLPYYAPAGTIIKITGDEGITTTDYHVAFDGNGTWTETVGPGVKTTIDPTTMPHKLVRNASNNTFSFSQCAWDTRVCGDDDTNPVPSFIGYTPNNITFYKNRFGILADENIIFSEAGGYFNFFAQTVAASLDTDSIDLAATSTDVSVLKHAIPFNEELLLFSDLSQFKVESGTTGLTPSDAAITLTTRFESKTNVTPVGAGNYLYFMQGRGDKAALREYYVQPDTTNYDSVDITAGVPSLISSSCYKLISNTIENTLVALTDDGSDSNIAPHTVTSNVTSTLGNKMYVYKYFWAGNDKVQSAWSYWEFPGVQIISAFSNESSLYIVANERTKANLYKIDLRNLEDTSLNMNVYLDQRAKLNGSYSAGTGLTTFTTPYPVNAGLQCVDATTGSDISIVATASCTITVTDYANIAVGKTIVLTKQDGTTITFTSESAGGSSPSSALKWRPNTSNNVTADNIYTAINAHADFTATNPAANVITVTRVVKGTTNLAATSTDSVRLAMTNFQATGTTVTTTGNISSAYLGFNFTSLYTLSTQYLREPGKTGGLSSITSGRLQVRTMSFDYSNTGFFQVVVTHNNRDPKTYSFNGYIIDNSTALLDRPVIETGTLRVPIQAQNTQHTVTVKSSSYLPVNVVSAEMEGFYYRRSTRA